MDGGDPADNERITAGTTGELTRPKGKPTKRWYQRSGTWVIAAVVAGVATFVAGSVTQLLSSTTSKIRSIIAPRSPINIAIEHIADCPYSYVIPSNAVDSVPPPPSIVDGSERRERWAKDLRGIDGGATLLRITVTGTSEHATILQDLAIEAVERRAPVRGVEVHAVCGDALQARFLNIDLDQKPPSITSTSDYRRLGGEPIPEDPITFPYKVSSSQPEVFFVIASTKSCDCSWRVKLRWVSSEDSGESVIDNDGDPFRTTGTGSSVSYFSNEGEPLEPVR